MISISINEAQLEVLHHVDMNLAHVGPDIKRKLLTSLSKKVLGYSRQHAQAQTDLSGLPYAPHKRGRRRKMLVRLARRLKIVSTTDSEAVIGFSNALEGVIGYKQQYGHTELFNKSQFAGRVNLNSDAPATRRQAKSLLAAGYKVRKAGQAYRTPTTKWIVENLSIKRAGSILRLIRGSGTDSWMTTLPARSFLGATETEITELINMALEEFRAMLNAAL